MLGGDAADHQGHDPLLLVAQAIEDGQSLVVEELDPPIAERAELDHRDRLAVAGAVQRVLRRAGRDDRRRAAEAQPRLIGDQDRLLRAVDDDVGRLLRLQVDPHQLAPDGDDRRARHARRAVAEPLDHLLLAGRAEAELVRILIALERGDGAGAHQPLLHQFEEAGVDPVDLGPQRLQIEPRGGHLLVAVD